jgi:hypothetical protein
VPDCGGQRFESPQLHHEVRANRRDFQVRRIARHSRGLRPQQSVCQVYSTVSAAHEGRRKGRDSCRQNRRRPTRSPRADQHSGRSTLVSMSRHRLVDQRLPWLSSPVVIPFHVLSWLRYPSGDEQVLTPANVEHVMVSASAGLMPIRAAMARMIRVRISVVKRSRASGKLPPQRPANRRP